MDVFYKVKLILQNKNRLTDLEKKLIVAGGMNGRERDREFGINRYTLLFKMDHQQSPVHTGSCCQEFGCRCASAKQKYADRVTE